MIDIISDKEKLTKSLRELEFEFAQGNISKSAYNLQKRNLIKELDTLEVADRVKRLQGKGETEKPLEYWTEKKKEEKAAKEKEELMQRYMTSTKAQDLRNPGVKKGGTTVNRAILTAVVVLIFFSGIAFGFLILNGPSESAAVPMLVNQSAFPVHNNTTNITNVTSSANITKTTTNTGGNTGGSTGSNTGTGGSSGNTKTNKT